MLLWETLRKAIEASDFGKDVEDRERTELCETSRVVKLSKDRDSFGISSNWLDFRLKTRRLALRE
jgi:hypothetical protein